MRALAWFSSKGEAKTVVPLGVLAKLVTVAFLFNRGLIMDSAPHGRPFSASPGGANFSFIDSDREAVGGGTLLARTRKNETRAAEPSLGGWVKKAALMLGAPTRLFLGNPLDRAPPSHESAPNLLYALVPRVRTWANSGVCDSQAVGYLSTKNQPLKPFNTQDSRKCAQSAQKWG